MAKGLDVSNNNGHVDWARIAADGYRFAWAKATEGTSFVDPFYTLNRAGAHAHGIAFGAYHYFTPGVDALAQAAFFLEHAQPKAGDLVPTLDYERSPATPRPAEEFVSRLHRDLGYWPVFYSYLSFIEEMRASSASPLARCELWLADYTTVRPAPPAPWKQISVWQHTSTGSVPGIGGPVDLDAGTPEVVPAVKPAAWDITYHDKTGAKHQTRVKRPKDGPALWLARHPNPKYNGRIIIDPVHKAG